MKGNNNTIRELLDKGLKIRCPESVEIGRDIDPRRISGEDVTIHGGCRIHGPKTLIMPGVELGCEAQVTLKNCRLGPKVELKGGVFYDSCFLDRVTIGSGAQIREACLLEEGVRLAHTVGLKHTILFPFLTLGSLINFCDCLMAGGTDEKNHSEVGSSFVHFNCTPNQDKATASLIGDVPKGVMLNQPPIFLGGQGGIVGPVRVEYGTVVAAGTILRKNVLKGGTIILGYPALSRSITFHPGLYTNVRRIIELNSLYIANIIALRRWYLDIRYRIMDKGPMEKDLLDGAIDIIDKAIAERLKRLRDVANRMPRSIEIYQKIGSKSGKTIQTKQKFFKTWPDMERVFNDSLNLEGNGPQKENFIRFIENAVKKEGKDYIRVIKGLTRDEAGIGTGWLQGLVDEIMAHVFSLMKR